jgi:hypothetical protein
MPGDAGQPAEEFVLRLQGILSGTRLPPVLSPPGPE